MDPQQKADAIRDLLQTDGWQIVASFTASKIDFHKAQLMFCPIEDVLKHRTTIRAFESISVHLDEIIKNSLEGE